jgi:hypothetical protein
MYFLAGPPRYDRYGANLPDLCGLLLECISTRFRYAHNMLFLCYDVVQLEFRRGRFTACAHPQARLSSYSSSASPSFLPPSNMNPYKWPRILHPFSLHFLRPPPPLPPTTPSHHIPNPNTPKQGSAAAPMSTHRPHHTDNRV